MLSPDTIIKMATATLNKKLHESGIIYKSGGTWVLYHKYQDKGYTATQTYLYKDGMGNDCTQLYILIGNS